MKRYPIIKPRPTFLIIPPRESNKKASNKKIKSFLIYLPIAIFPPLYIITTGIIKQLANKNAPIKLPIATNNPS